jgi:hypothetical protein
MMPRPQFSIRTLLWLTLVVAVGCVVGPSLLSLVPLILFTARHFWLVLVLAVIWTAAIPLLYWLFCFQDPRRLSVCDRRGLK